jgi:uncharacterized protein
MVPACAGGSARALICVNLLAAASCELRRLTLCLRARCLRPAPVLPYLLATLLALLTGPLIYAAAARHARTRRVLDIAVIAAISALVVFEVLPQAWTRGGWPVLPFLLAGLLGPTLIERVFHRHERQAHLGAMALAVGGLVLHTLADGVVLSPGHAGEHALPLAVVVHSLPVGVGVWWLLAPHFGTRIAAAALLLMCVGTVTGYLLGVPLERALGETAWSWLQALVAGSILHVVFGRPHLGHPHGNATI